MKQVIGVAAVLALLLVAAGCGSGYGNSGGSSTTTGSSGSGGGQKAIAGVQANDHGTKAVATSGKTEVELGDYYFKPTVLEGTAGQKVTLELKNDGQVEHTFTIDAQGIDQDLQPGDTAEVTVTIPKSGAVSFYCKFHKSSGMAGALAVTGQAGGTGGMTDTGTTTGKGYGY
jgi:plastocyanin